MLLILSPFLSGIMSRSAIFITAKIAAKLLVESDVME